MDLATLLLNLILGFAFGGFLYAFLVLIFRMFTLIRRTRGWITVNAIVRDIRIMNITLDKATDDGLAKLEPDSDKLQEIQVVVEYEFAGTQYQGNRLSIRDDSPPFGSNFDRRIFDYLRNANREGKSVTIWVDKNNPGNSIITREPYVFRLVVYTACIMGAMLGIYSMVQQAGPLIALAAALAGVGVAVTLDVVYRRSTVSRLKRHRPRKDVRDSRESW